MKHTLKSAVTTTGRRMAGARSLWRANGMREEQFGRPVIGIANSFTQLVPGHVHLHEIGQYVKQRIEALGCFAAEFNTIAVDDGIAMGHDGMLYSLPSREIIADSVEYMASAHKIDALVCISNCDKITPGMLMAALRLNIPTVFVSGGPMEAGKFQGRGVDLIDAMVMGADETCSDAQIAEIERCACPGCGSCSGMFTANSMNCLTEALGLSLPGNGPIVATHVNRRRLFEDAAALIVRNAERYYFEGDERVLPRSIATKAAFENAMSLDIAMGGSTNTVLHLLAVAHEAGVDFTMQDIDRLSRRVPVLCKVAPNSHYHIQDVNRAGGIFAILGELDRAGLLDTSVLRVDGRTLGEAIPACDILNPAAADAARRRALSAPAGHYSRELGAQHSYYEEPDTDRTAGCISDEWLESVCAALPELQPEKMARYQSEYGLSEYDSRILTESKKMADMFEKTTTICQKPKKAANWLIGEASRLLKEKGQDAESLWFSPMHLAQLIDLVDAGTINNNTAKEVFTAIFEQDVDPSAYVEAHGLGMVNDDSALEQAVSDVLAANPKTVEEYKSGKTKVLGFLVGQVMKLMKGKANPGKVNEMMTEKLNA